MTPIQPPSLVLCKPSVEAPLTWTPGHVLHGRAEQRAWILYEDPSGQFSAGIWECDEGCWRVNYTENEFVQMLSGRIRIVDAGQVVREVGVGDSFVVPQGFQGTWEVLEPARKYFAIYEDKRGSA